ncbi:MAG TPA: cob(I)yrinic acid a,c-diamide adenosyltransferase [Bacteroidia bacterium]|jgi:cob(I)alamin adenosyltransferase|nr:cob(I)yrinic acid a,c-diamide adenosyltransferase [Bacteroidia bacterium]
MALKIYTKTGDKGQTSLLGGTRVPKNNIRIEAYGTVDELNSWIGLLRDSINDKHVGDILIEVQDRLFTMGSSLATDPAKSKVKIPHLSEDDITVFEKEIDAMDAQLPPMKNFVLPGGHITVSHCHIARCVCRRAERRVIHLAENEKVDELVVKYLNRLSDYLFMLSRKLTQDLKATEVPWKPKM